jgi:hypothetical protein
MRVLCSDLERPVAGKRSCPEILTKSMQRLACQLSAALEARSDPPSFPQILALNFDD